MKQRAAEKRALVLALLHKYRPAGVFPKSYDHRERRPCFTDRDGTICAVGYLIEKTAGRRMAQNLNEKHQYKYLLDMKEEEITRRASVYGLTLEGCTALQPAYGYSPPAVKVFIAGRIL